MIYTFLIFIFLWYGSIFFHSAYLHRYSTHHSFHLSPIPKRIFGILTYLFLGSSYMSAMVYSDMHLRHHEHADKSRDPHSPKNHSNPLRFLLIMFINFNRHFNKLIPPIYPLQLLNPLWWERFLSSGIVKTVWVMIYFVLYYSTSKNIILSIFLTSISSMQGPIQGFLVNWFGHNGVKATPHNFLSTDLLLLGEAYHRNHHLNEKCADFSDVSTNKDFTYIILMCLNNFNFITIKK